MGFRQLSLRNKLMVLLVPLGILYALGVGYLFLDTTDTLIKQVSSEEEKQNSIIISQAIKDFQTKALTIATIFAANDNVVPAYKNSNEEEGSNYLKNSISPIIKRIQSESDIKDFQIHYHKPPAKSFLRSWTKKRFDDLSKFRPTILEVSSSQRPVKAIEFGVGGFAVRGIAPIINNTEYLGSVEFLYDIKDILNLITTDTNSTGMFNIVVAKTAENALKPDQIKEFYPIKYGDFYLSKTSNEWLDQELLLTDEVLAEMNATNNVIIKNIGDLFYSFNPLFDLNSQKIGYVAFVKNNKKIIDQQMKSIYLKVGLIILMVQLFIGSIIYAVYRFIIKPIKLATEIARDVAAGNFSSITKEI